MADTIIVEDLTEATLEGNGIFDVLMRANKAHLDAEYTKNRIKGTEYSTVYLGSLEPILRASLEFLLQRNKAAAEARLIEQQILVAKAEIDKVKAQTELVKQQTDNAVIEATVLLAQECKLRAEYDVLLLQKAKVSAETGLLVQKVVTEQAQVTEMGVDANSVIGKQKALYGAQTDGFKRDAEQKAATIMVGTWNARRMTDEGTIADGTNRLGDVDLGRTITKLLNGIGA